MTDHPEIINLISDDEDDDLKRAIALSLEGAPDAKSHDRAQGEVDPSMSDELELNDRRNLQGKLSAKPGFLGLNRKQMELDRLARLKRKRDQDTDSTAQPHFNASPTRTVSPPPSRRPISRPVTAWPASQSKVGHSMTETLRTPFVDGVTLLTAESPRRAHTSNALEAVSFAEVVKAPSSFVLKSCLLSSFVVDFDWLLPHFDTKNTSFVLCLHAPTTQHRTYLEQDFGGIANVKLVFPKLLGGVGAMHSKLMLLFYKSLRTGATSSICRVVVPSANLVPHDWGVGQVMENVVFILDLPANDNHEARQKNDTTSEFKDALITQLKAFGVANELIVKLEMYDFTQAKAFRFVHSTAGSHAIHDSFQTVGPVSQMGATISNETSTQIDTGSQITGLLRLSEAVASLGLSLEPDDMAYPPKLDFVTSSLGNLSSKFLENLFLAVCGGIATNSSQVNLTKKTISASRLDEILRPCLSIYFPSARTVRDSRGGVDAAGTICFQRKWWETVRTEFPKECLRDCVGVRGDGILSHSKILYVRFRQPKTVQDTHGDCKTYAGWAYVGSANLSESAWGTVTAKSRNRPAKITCRNWETGILIPIEQRMQLNRSSDPPKSSPQDNENNNNAFQPTVPETSRGSSNARTSDRTYTKQPDAQSTAPIGANAKHKAQGLSEDLTSIGLPNLVEVFGGAVPIPMSFPAASFTKSRSEPWFFNS